jgi:hypothetical protein
MEEVGAGIIFGKGVIGDPYSPFTLMLILKS